VLAGLAGEARARGIERAFLQVEEKNTPARALYRRAGFAPAWRYFYWSRPAG
jgi:ribosomal protein S18 acetylase RimI-like enzyme